MPITRPTRYCDRCGGRLARDNSDSRCGACRSVRDVLLAPPSVSRDFWETDQMRDALATWHMGRVIHAYRMHPRHPKPLPQELIGNWLGLTQAQLSRIENGRAPEELSKLVRYAQILGIPGELLWFKLPEVAAPAPSDVQRRRPALSLPVLIEGRSIQLPVDVTEARARGLGGLIDGLADERGSPGSGGPPFVVSTPTRHNPSPQARSAGDVAELEHLAAALDDARRYLDGSVVDYFRAQLDMSKADDGNRGAHAALPMVLGTLDVIAAHVREVKPAVRCALLSVGADGAEFAGWLYRDLQDPATATFWYDRAMEWAQEARDTVMQGYVLLRKSQMAYDLRDAHRVVTFAEAAHQGPWRFPFKVRAEVAQQTALGLAMIGEPMSAVVARMDSARELLTQATPHDEEPGPGSSYFTIDTLLLRQAACYTEAGKPATAAALFSEVITSGRLSRRDAGFFNARRAAALALSGEPDQAAIIGLEAAHIGQETNSGRTMRLLGEVVQTLKPWSSRPAPHALQQAVLTNAQRSNPPPFE